MTAYTPRVKRCPLDAPTRRHGFRLSPASCFSSEIGTRLGWSCRAPCRRQGKPQASSVRLSAHAGELAMNRPACPEVKATVGGNTPTDFSTVLWLATALCLLTRLADTSSPHGAAL